jgi:Zinc finger, C2H2 type/Zinc-finger of C2H2 type
MEKALALKNETTDEWSLLDTKPDGKLFMGGLAVLPIQPVAHKNQDSIFKLEEKKLPPLLLLPLPKLKSEHLEDLSHELHSREPLRDIKPFAGNLQTLPIRLVEIPDVKPQRLLKKFTCDLCQKGVGTKGGLLYHMKAHLNGRPFKCKICKRSYSTKNDFDTHNKRHAGTKFTCDFCNRNFASKQYLADHISALHLTKDLKCQFCKKDKYFSSVKAIRIHQMTSHFVALSDRTKIYSCSMGCGFKTINRIIFESHELVAKKMGFKCSICLKTFSCYKLLFAHIKTENKSIVECKICKGSFKNIRYHMKRRHTTRACKFCKFETSDANAFSAHSLQCATPDQLRSKGHLCIECDIYFYSELSLLSHVSTKHGKIICSICPARFNQKRALRNHMGKHQKNPIRCLCPKFPMFQNMKAFNSHFNSAHKTMRMTRKVFFGLCLICWAANKKKEGCCRTKTQLEEHMLFYHQRMFKKKISAASP